MDPIVFTAVIIASMFHATWNGMVKKHSNKVKTISFDKFLKKSLKKFIEYQR